MKRLPGLMAMTFLLATQVACGTSSDATTKPQAAYGRMSASNALGISTLRPLVLEQGAAATDAQVDPKLLRVRKVAIEAIEEANKSIAAFNASGDMAHLAEADRRLVRSLTMVQDILDGEKDPMADKMLDVIDAAVVEGEAVVKAFEKSLFKTDAKRVKVVCTVINLRAAAIQRVYDLTRVAIEN